MSTEISEETRRVLKEATDLDEQLDMAAVREAVEREDSTVQLDAAPASPLPLAEANARLSLHLTQMKERLPDLEKQATESKQALAELRLEIADSEQMVRAYQRMHQPRKRTAKS
jgi:hypothetical protein